MRGEESAEDLEIPRGLAMPACCARVRSAASACRDAGRTG
jgi:hypothetical protein